MVDSSERIEDVDVSTEMRGSFLEYAYSVIYSRALPDARDGLKPVQRRILFQMNAMGLRPDRGHVKSARVVGEVMGRLHPHGDGAIYDALVRMAQPFSLRLPMVDGHGNFGSLDDGPAAMRYTECRLAPPAMVMTQSLDEDVVDLVANYDGRETEPEVLPSAIPNLLVNGASGIAVGMATNLPPHNLGEVVAAARHLLQHPNARLDTLMRFVPGPDLPSGGIIVGLDGIREAYETGRGRFRMRAVTSIENVTPRRQGIVVTALPYGVGPERVIGKIKELVLAKKIQGIANLTDLTDADHGLRLIVEIKSGFNPEAVRAALFKATPLEEQFSINSVALVDGKPEVLGLKQQLTVFLDHRREVIRRRTQYRLQRAQDRLHLVDGLLIAIVDIDEVIAIIRGSDDAGQARHRLISAFELTEVQANYILDMPLRRLTKFSRIELETEAAELAEQITDLQDILAREERLVQVVSAELAEVAAEFGDERRTLLLAEEAQDQDAAPIEIPDDPCRVFLTSKGTMARSPGTEQPIWNPAAKGRHGAVRSVATTTRRATAAVICSDGQARLVSVLDLPELPASEPQSLAGGVPLKELIDLPPNVQALAVAATEETTEPLALATSRGLIKRVQVVPKSGKDSFEIMKLTDDSVVGAATAPDDAELVLVSQQGQLLKFPAKQVRVQGMAAGGMAGIKLRDDDCVVALGAVERASEAVISLVCGQLDALPGTEARSGKTTPIVRYPNKGRGTGGVRCVRFRKGEDAVTAAWVGLPPVLAIGNGNRLVPAPAADDRRDGTGQPLSDPVLQLGGNQS